MEWWGFIWLMVILKIPLIGAFWIVWWAIHAVDDPASSSEGDEGGQGDREPPSPTPRSCGPEGWCSRAVRCERTPEQEAASG